jgi:hypothetical protein
MADIPQPILVDANGELKTTSDIIQMAYELGYNMGKVDVLRKTVPFVESEYNDLSDRTKRALDNLKRQYK